jgi:O-antigen ligase
MLSLLGVFHYVNRVFYLGFPEYPSFFLLILIIAFLVFHINKKKVCIDSLSLVIATGGAIFLLLEIVGYLFDENHFEYRVVRSLMDFGLYYFSLTLIFDKYAMIRGLIVDWIIKIYLTTTVVISTLTLLSILMLDNNYFFGVYVNKGYLISSAKIMYMSILGLYFLWLYPKQVTSKVKRNFYILLFFITPILANKTGAILLLILFGILYIYSIKFSIKSMVLSILSIWIILISASNFNSENLLHGIDSSMEIIPQAEILKGADQKQSTYIRHTTNRKALDSFYKKPILGSGEYHVKNEIRYAGYFTHTFYIYVLTSYGLIGGIFIFMFFLTLGFSKMKSIRNSFRKKVLYLYILYILLFIPVIPLWIIPAILTIKKYK